MTLEGRYVGLILAICSSLLIGISFVVTKKGLQNSSTAEHGRASDSHRYLKNPVWWIGLIVMVMGEILNFIGYTFAPAILITPLGALSVIVGYIITHQLTRGGSVLISIRRAILGSIFLKEKMGPIGIIGCLLSIIGAVIIIFHAPEDPEVQSVQELVAYMLKPGFLVYGILVILIVVGMIWKVVPKYGKTKPLVYLSICSLIGSLSVMAVKAFGIAVKLTIAGNNQFNQPSTYIFGFMCVLFILIQVNYFNKALDLFCTNVVNPIYYVCFTTATIIASAIMFQGWNTASLTNTVSLICGFLIIFSGVYLLDMIAPLSNVTSSSLLELPFSSSSCRVSSIAVATVVTEKSCWDEYTTDTDNEGESHPNAISRRPSSAFRPRALSV